MPASPTARMGLIGPVGTDAVAIGDDQIRAFLALVDAQTTIYTSGTLASRPAAGINGRIYKATDNTGVYLDNGSNWLTIIAPLVSALPGSPVDGDRVDYLADAASGTIWPLVYRAADPSSTKWNARGATSLVAEVAAAESSSGSVYAALATAGPSITVPLNGDYLVEVGSVAQNGGNGVYHSFDVGGTAASDNDAGLISPNPGATTLYRRRRKTGLTATTAIVSKYKSLGGSSTFGSRSMAVTPIRVG